jgi:hypothetical protein
MAQELCPTMQFYQKKNPTKLKIFVQIAPCFDE